MNMPSSRSDQERPKSHWLSTIAVVLALLASIVALHSLGLNEDQKQIRDERVQWQALEQETSHFETEAIPHVSDQRDVAESDIHPIVPDQGAFVEANRIPLVTRLTVVSINRSEPLINLVDWGVLDLTQLPPVKILIQATRETVKSVEVRIDGTLLAIRDEFPMFVTDMASLHLPNGTHWISVIPYSQSNATGIRGPEHKVSFVIVDKTGAPSVQGLAIFPDTVSSVLVSAVESDAPPIVDLPISQPRANIPIRISAFPRPDLRFQAFIDSSAITTSLNDFPFDFVLENVELGLHSIIIVSNIQSPGTSGHYTFFLNVVKSPFYPVQNSPEIIQFVLHDAQTSEDVSDFQINDGFIMNSPEVYKHARIPTIRARTNPEAVGSVRFQLDGITISISNEFPYRIGDNNFELKSGSYNLSATAFSLPNVVGTAGSSRHVLLTFK